MLEFKCSQGLLFDVARQICDFKANVDNCDVILGMYLTISSRSLNEDTRDFKWYIKFEKFIPEEEPPKPLLENGNCEEGSLACGDGSCLSAHYFCDGNPDCSDNSDEAYCGKCTFCLRNFYFLYYREFIANCLSKIPKRTSTRPCPATRPNASFRTAGALRMAQRYPGTCRPP